jgi:hypothetical protein
MLALPDADASLKGPEIVRNWSLVPEFAKKIEQAGKGYAALQHLVEFGPKEEEKVVEEEVKKSDSDDENGDDEDDGTAKDYARKKPKKTKEEIDREQANTENYYQLLHLPDIDGKATEK